MAKKSPAAARRAIDRLKLNDILAKVRKDEHWTASQAREADLWYRRFLWLSFEHGDKPLFGISQKSDDLWHAHILYTKRYRADCQRIFGHYLDHTPTTARLTKRQLGHVAQSERWYVAEFGMQPIDLVMICYHPPRH